MEHYFDSRIKTLAAVILIGLLVLASISCVSARKRAEKCQKWGVCATTTDSVYIEKVKIDSVEVDRSDIWLDMLFTCDSNGNVLVQRIDSISSENANLQASLKDNRIIISGTVPTKSLPCRPCAEITRKETKIVTVTKNELTSWQGAQMWLGRAFLFVIGIVMIVFGLWLRFRKQ